ncbi:DUF202 domain-containing protein [Allosaccharopolyspora coralli]|uniref:DUF202 domain-containing protein n=1 Tax=Allosaccharopolyspora coralli TaxID=2665642 RepID=A0A5Q3Q9T5_9PSEU|nr:DUF202 domain-containing protein [Allosaccharopolyspora coralli]QGK71232.1 DUF202 domain-containing protein [Allosaccharopolyspora coralli]
MTSRWHEPESPGLQVERTTLAWLRTSLAFVVGLLLIVRFVAHHSALLAAIGITVALPAALLVAALAARRFRHSLWSLPTHDTLPDGALPAGVAALGLVVGSCGVAYVLLN